MKAFAFCLFRLLFVFGIGWRLMFCLDNFFSGFVAAPMATKLGYSGLPFAPLRLMGK